MRNKFLILVVFWFSGTSVWCSSLESLGPFGGDVRSLAVHEQKPNRFFLGTSDGQVYVSKNSGETWEKLVPGLNRRDLVIDNLVFDPNDPNTLYAGCWELKRDKGWLYRSSDGGASWEDVPLGSFASPVRAVAIAPSAPHVIALGITEGVILSEDGGQTWDRITRGYRSLYNVESLAFDPTDSATLYVGTWRLGWKTENRGKKWAAIHEGMIFDSDMFSLLVNPENPNVLFSSACTGVYRSDNAGKAWVKLKNGLPGEAKRTRTLHLDPSDLNRVYAGTTIGLFRSENGGGSWTQLVSDIVVNAVAVNPGNQDVILLATDDGGIWRSTDRGQNFEPSNQGFVHRQIEALRAAPGEDGRLVASVGSDGSFGGVFISTNGGRDWTSYNQGLEGLNAGVQRILVGSKNPIVFLGTRSGVYRGIPGEQDWKLVSATKGKAISDFAFLDASEQQVVFATSKGLLVYDEARKKIRNWKIPVYTGPIHGLHLDRESGYLYAATDMGVFRVQGASGTWVIRVKGLPPIRINQVTGRGDALAVATADGVYFSRDGSETWVAASMDHELEIAQLELNPADTKQLFAVDSTGFFVFMSEDGGASWREIPSNNRSRLTQLTFTDSGDLLAGSISEGIYRLSKHTVLANRGEGE